MRASCAPARSPSGARRCACSGPTPTPGRWPDGSEAKLAERGMLRGSRPQRPAVLAVALVDDDVVDAGVSHGHEPVLGELPVLVPVAPKPVAAVVVPFVGEPHGDPVFAEGPHL